ncbi:sigma-54 dependent transcriptional regulator [Cognatiyoonia sp. IB215182]|uniref:sigma-54-dependent transcriptional regulator n=1 Tax=Cognatiyoonia sp. IB215182 TaxID=3097353 RepID=UPI002A16BA64|nr:sigma-54 dependent transcriptional regulator [Cognatiyoonia sp. IB215182]MDX8352508.1 sigma-54 dependent transcriptional regulator [Cognatiyoonia sp. IB215182]
MPMDVVFVDDEEHLRLAAAQSFDLDGLSCACYSTASAALDALSPEYAGVVVTDIRMPGMDGLALLHAIKQMDAELPVILVTGHGDVELAVAAMKDGAYDFIEKPWAAERLLTSVRRGLDHRRLTLENRALKGQITSGDAIHARLPGRSAVMRDLRTRLAEVAHTQTDILITGDTGTGKEVAARALHAAGDRAAHPFVHVNCAGLPETLIESELFGYEAGAYPGAMRARIGRVEHAHRGTLCLDEIDDLPLSLQAKLLNVLDNRHVTRLGANEPIPLDLRVITISKTPLETAVAQGRFRPDLLYRLNPVTLHMPSLAERREDIPALLAHFLNQAATRHDKPVPHISPEQQIDIAGRAWPGNVRELRNFAERLVLGIGESAVSNDVGNLAVKLADYERGLIASAIAAHGGRLKETYEALGVSRKTLYDKMKRHGLTRPFGSDGGDV